MFFGVFSGGKGVLLKWHAENFLNKKNKIFKKKKIINACTPLLYPDRVNIMSAGRLGKVLRRKTQ